jgi:hypothetical protein
VPGASSGSGLPTTGKPGSTRTAQPREAGQPAATLLARSFGWQFSLLGATVIVGLDKDADRWAGLSEDQVGAILRRITGAP